MAETLKAKKEFDGAERELRKVYESKIAVYGNHHRYIVNAFNRLGCLMYAKGDFAQALENFEEAQKIAHICLGDDHKVTIEYNRNISLARNKIK